MTENFDVIICGAGPAGSTCALALGKSGLKVALLEKGIFPRDKICGDAVPAYIPKILNTIDPKYAEAIKAFKERESVDTVRLVAPNEKFLDLKFSESGFISTRMHFDNFLYEQAASLPNVKVFLNAPIKKVSDTESGVTVEAGENIRLEGKIVVGCDGAHSVVQKCLTDTKIDLRHYCGGVRAYYKNVTGIPKGVFELHFIKDVLPGYFWIFPLPDNMANVGLGMLSDSISENKVNLRKELDRTVTTIPYIKSRFQHAEQIGETLGFGLPLGSRKVTISGDHFMLCGDAASLIDPASGEGIGNAMVSGRYAGWHAVKCFEKNDFSGKFMKGYDKMVYDKLWPELRKRAIGQRIFKNQLWALNVAVTAGSKSKFLEAILRKMIW